MKTLILASSGQFITANNIDIAGKNEEELKKALDGHDIVMVEGGNTFYLLKAVRESGFENVIKDLIAKGVVYVGSSAGSYIACPSIVMATWSTRGFDRCLITEYSAMNLVPFLIKAHYTPEMKAMLDEKAKDLQYHMRVLNDDQAILVRDGEVQLLGGGDEIIL